MSLKLAIVAIVFTLGEIVEAHSATPAVNGSTAIVFTLGEIVEAHSARPAVSGSTEPTFYCPERNQLFYMQFNSNSEAVGLQINVSPLFSSPVTLNVLSDVNRVIQKGPVSIVILNITLNEDTNSAKFDVLVVLNLTSVDSEVVVTCYDGMAMETGTFMPLQDDFVLDIKVKSLVTTTNTLFFAEWDHPSLAGFLHYRTELMVNETMVHSNNISHPYSYCFIDEYESPFILFVYAFDLCGGKEIGSINEDFPETQGFEFTNTNTTPGGVHENVDGSTEPTFYCPEQNQLFYMQCDSSSEAVGLQINVSPLFSSPVTLNVLSDVNRVIQKGPVSIVILNITLNEDTNSAKFDVLVVLNLTSVDSEVVVTCYDGMAMETGTFMPLQGGPSDVQNIKVVFDETFVFAEWYHSSPAQIHHYETELRVNEELIHNEKVTSSYSYCYIDRNTPSPISRPGAAFTFAIIAVDHCGLKSKYEMTGSFSGNNTTQSTASTTFKATQTTASTTFQGHNNIIPATESTASTTPQALAMLMMTGVTILSYLQDYT